MPGVKLSRGRHRNRSKSKNFSKDGASSREPSTRALSSREQSSRERSSRDHREPPPPNIRDASPSLERRQVYSPPRISTAKEPDGSTSQQQQPPNVPDAFYLVSEKSGRAPSIDSQLTEDTEEEVRRRRASSSQRHHSRNLKLHQRHRSYDHDYYYEIDDRGRDYSRSSRDRDRDRDRSRDRDDRGRRTSRSSYDHDRRGRGRSRSPYGGSEDLAYQLHGGDVQVPSPYHRQRLNKWYRKQNPVLSRSASDSTDDVEYSGSQSVGTEVSAEESNHVVLGVEENLDRDTSRALDDMENDYLRTKQSVAYLAILLTAGQLLVLMLQLSMCGMAPFDVNGFVGPYPAAFSQWGGKNPYLMVQEQEWWRLVSPSLLHIGILHLLANSFCQLDAIALFEREWGSFRWLIVYLISSVGCSAFSSTFDPNTIAVGSSGALMGMYGAKLAQVTTLTCFEVKNFKVDEVVQLDQLSSVLCGLTLVSILSSFSYIDWSGHMGGLLCGFLSGVVLFCGPIQSCCSWFLWLCFGLFSLLGTLAGVFYLLIEKIQPDEDIADPCEYFRSFFPEDYNCDCMWEW